ncbi:kinase-like protein [Lojkania enalia]|uniref:Kinase-like protein n=1 Tax=Lojkania enalia TaxID=147567 RepID=A0A9P4JZ29_9PLEO|nr:kinase-like protein [Didymosphaeria enalia]
MDLFTSSYAASQFSTISLSTVDSLLGQSDSRPHQEFIQFLQYAISLNVPILPVTWEPAFEALGPDGTTGRVNQSPLNSEFILAYKRFNPRVTDPRMSANAYRSLQYSAMASEMTVLSNPVIRSHPNIITLQGICFELSSATGDVWPVLVFERAALGDLEKFVSQHESLNLEDLLSICGYIAKAIKIMHQCGVAHGDLKPGNVVVQEDVEQSAQGIKVIDFGFSSYNSADEDFVRVARTEPWEAPEWHNRGFTLQAAKAMDIYSFGLLCMWLFFREETLADLNFPSATIAIAFAKQNPEATAKIQALKKCDDELLAFALRLLEQKPGVEDGVRARMQQGLISALALDPEKRPSSMDPFIELFCDPEYLTDPEPSGPLAIVNPPDWHGNLQIENSFFNLETCDFRVHSFLAQSLVSMAQGEGCDTCSSNAAFQLALCYLLGFGVQADKKESDKWLHASSKTAAEMSNTLQRIRQRELGDPVTESLTRLGYSGSLNITYEQDGVLGEAIQQYQNMVLAQENLFGPAHFSPIRLRGILVTLLRWNNQFQESLSLALYSLKIGEDLDIHQLDLLGLKAGLVEAYMSLGEMEKAEFFARGIEEAYAAGPYKDHVARLRNQGVLARILLERENYEEAVELGQEAEQNCISKLGIHHDITLSVRRSLVTAYDRVGNLEKAVEVNERLLEAREKCNVADDPILIEDLSRLSVQYCLLGKHDAAQRCYHRIDALVAENIKNAAPAVNSANNYATHLISRGELDKAVTILKYLFVQFEASLGPKRGEFILVMGNLAAAYQFLEQWESAEPLERRVWEARRELLGNSHPHTITALRNLATNLLRQNRFAEAAALRQEELCILESVPETSDETKISVVSEIARILVSAKDWAGALPFFEQELEWKHPKGGKTPSKSLSGMALVATCFIKLDHVSKARPMILNFINQVQRGGNESADNIIPCVISLAAACLERECLIEAEQVLVIGVFLSQQLSASSSDLRLKLEAEVDQFLKRRGTEDMSLVFNPSNILPEGT